MMSKIFRVSRLLPVVLLLSGCGGLVDDVYLTDIGGRGFSHYLFDEYKALVKYESDEMRDLRDAEYYSVKAMKADAGEFVEPTLLSERDIAPEFLPEMAHARSELINALLALNADKAHWRDLAKAQASFDCWLEQQEEGFQTEDIMNCRDDFYQAMDRVLGKVEIREAFMVFFGHDAASLDPQAMGSITVIARILLDNPDLDAVVTGNADTSGGEKYNDGLSLKRAQAVVAALKDGGVEPARISLFSEGERNLLVQTPDNVKEEKNRRVDILVKVHKAE